MSGPLEEEDWQRLIQGLRDGDNRVVTEFCQRYGEALHDVAQRNFPGGLRRRLEPEDVVQSACRTFLRRVGVGEFHLPDSESLWRLLCAITLTKVREQARFHLRQKRGLDREQRLPSPDESGASGFGPPASGPTPAEAAAFADQFQQLMASLDELAQQVVDLKLQECTNAEIADRLSSSERSVGRILQRVKTRLTAAFEPS